MPGYVITTRRGPEGATKFDVQTAETLGEARRQVQTLAQGGAIASDSQRAWARLDACEITESGGTLGPYPDGTWITVTPT